ncbi:hypothetical protein [Pseudodesulfovibrio profundus]|uniref:hypothetical protein n=1 Tax=Pseudodesulfovibrio profundus TaxID=57320 RepID=UPI00138FE640|nr:hypothetical protein [Pseudodesulfovibrio profundus]
MGNEEGFFYASQIPAFEKHVTRIFFEGVKGFNQLMATERAHLRNSVFHRSAMLKHFLKRKPISQNFNGCYVYVDRNSEFSNIRRFYKSPLIVIRGGLRIGLCLSSSHFEKSKLAFSSFTWAINIRIAL